MSRDDSLLYTGATSASFSSPKEQSVKEKQALSKQERLDRRHKLKPSAEIINNILDGERALVIQDIASLPVDLNTSNQNVKEVLLAYQRNLLFIDRVRNKVNIALRESSHE